MTDERPRPRYGEYATPEIQVGAGGTVVPVPATPSVEKTRGRSSDARVAWSSKVGAGDPPPARTRRRWDLYLTSILLAYGLFTVISGLFQYSDLAAVIQQVYTAQGIGRFTSVDGARLGGLVVNIVNLALFAVTAVLTYRRLRARKISFWLPLVGGAVAGIVTAGVFMVLIFSDPAFTTYMASRG